MKVLLIKDVYKLGRAGDIKKVADGFGRNFLLPQGLAVLASAGALLQIEKIRTEATKRRAQVNNEMASVAEVLKKVALSFPVRASETGKLYGSITSQNVVDAIKTKTGITIKRQQVDLQPIRRLGEFQARIRLTVDLIPEVKVFAFREGDVNPVAEAAPAAAAAPAAEAEVAAEAQA